MQNYTQFSNKLHNFTNALETFQMLSNISLQNNTKLNKSIQLYTPLHNFTKLYTTAETCTTLYTIVQNNTQLYTSNNFTHNFTQLNKAKQSTKLKQDVTELHNN